MTEIDHAVARHNRDVRQREWCLVCEDRVPVHGREYIGAGGVLEGPFCSESCMFGWFD